MWLWLPKMPNAYSGGGISCSPNNPKDSFRHQALPHPLQHPASFCPLKPVDYLFSFSVFLIKSFPCSINSLAIFIRISFVLSIPIPTDFN
jgi:hypothetical protein